MNKLLALCCIILACLASKISSAQEGGYFSLGYNVSSYAKLDQLNFVIDRYNDTRTYLDQTMDNFKLATGFDFGIGYMAEHWIMDFSFVGRHKTQEANGVDVSGTTGFRQVKLRANTYNTGFGVRIGRFFTPGMSFDIGAQKTFTRAWYEGEDQPKFEKVYLSNILLAFSFFPQINIPFSDDNAAAFVIKPYYQFHFFRADFSELNNTINPNTSYIDVLPDEDKLNNFGVEVKLQL